MDKDSQIPSSLFLETKLLFNSGFSLLIVFSIFFLLFWPLQQTIVWLIQAGIIWTIIKKIVFKRLDLNKFENQLKIYPNLGWANRLTLFRGFLIAFTGGFLFQANLNEKILLIPALSYFLAAIIDRIDGYVARLTKQESLLGIELDTEFDAIGLLIAPALAAWIGQIHWSYLSVSLAYYLFQGGMLWRSRNNKPVYQLPTNMSRRAIAGFQMGFLAVVLWPILSPPATTVAGIAFMIPLLAGFIMDWFTVSGRLKLDDPGFLNFSQAVNRLTQFLILPALRLLIILLLYLCLMRNDSFSLSTVEPVFISSLLPISLLFSALMVLLGINGRFFAVILSCLLCWFFLTYQMHILDGILLTAVIWVMQFGTGKYSLWQWDELWVNRYDGV